MTLDEALSASALEDEITDVYCTLVSDESRQINVIERYKIIGVESDEKVERIKFKFPKVVGDNVDLSTLVLRVNYKNGNGEIDRNDTENVTTDETYIYFDWVLTRKVTKYKGTVNFIVCAIKANGDGTVTNEWNTTLAQSEVLEGLEVEITPDEEETARDLLTELLGSMKSAKDGHIAEMQAKADSVNASIDKAVVSAGNAKTELEKSTKTANDAKAAVDKSVGSANEAIANVSEAIDNATKATEEANNAADRAEQAANMNMTSTGTTITLQKYKYIKAFRGLKVYGKSTQDGTPSLESPEPIEIAGSDGTVNITISDSGSNSQTFPISTPNGLPGIPVESGGNYTDESGQQLIADVKDYGTGKYTQNIGQIASYNSEDVGDVWMSSTGQLTTGATVLYQLSAPVVTDISAEEMEAYKALTTYTPTTVISSDSGVWMETDFVDVDLLYPQAKDSGYDNSKSGLKSNKVQDAIDENAEAIKNVSVAIGSWKCIISMTVDANEVYEIDLPEGKAMIVAVENSYGVGSLYFVQTAVSSVDTKASVYPLATDSNHFIMSNVPGKVAQVKMTAGDAGGTLRVYQI